MIIRGIIKPLNTNAAWMNFVNRNTYSGYYLEGTNFFIQLRGRDRNELVIGDVKNAYKRGEECIFYTLIGNEFNCIYQVLAMFNYDVQAIYAACDAIDFDSKPNGTLFEKLSVSKRARKGVNTFSPFLLDCLNPLKEIPKKWTVNHVIRMLANEQFEGLRTSGKYTDDYAYDAAYDFQKGSVSRDAMLLELVEEPRGWWINGGDKDGDELGINCHSFDYKKCIVRLSGAKTIIEEKKPFSQDNNVKPILSPPPTNRSKMAGILMH
jgi:hypothetical protein